MERIGVGRWRRAGGGVRDPGCNDDWRRCVLQCVVARRFHLWEREGGVASRGDARAVGGRAQGAFHKIVVLQTRYTHVLYSLRLKKNVILRILG
jgi:hypothetical protein